MSALRLERGGYPYCTDFLSMPHNVPDELRGEMAPPLLFVFARAVTFRHVSSIWVLCGACVDIRNTLSG
jgi:hypothetical protein